MSDDSTWYGASGDSLHRVRLYLVIHGKPSNAVLPPLLPSFPFAKKSCCQSIDLLRISTMAFTRPCVPALLLSLLIFTHVWTLTDAVDQFQLRGTWAASQNLTNITGIVANSPAMDIIYLAAEDFVFAVEKEPLGELRRTW
jgi:hypothetical protein